MFDNRITTKISEVAAIIAEKGGAEALADLDATLAVTFEEHFAFQNAQARAHVTGLLTTDEAQVVYVALGEVGDPGNGGWAAGTDLATKVVVTQLMGELLARRAA
jgi:hypothetical protein